MDKYGWPCLQPSRRCRGARPGAAAAPSQEPARRACNLTERNVWTLIIHVWYLKIKSLCLQVNFCGKLKYFKCRSIFGTTHLVSMHVRDILHLRFHQLMATRSEEKLVGFSDCELESESFKAKFIWFWTNEENWITCQRTRGHKGERQGLMALNKENVSRRTSYWFLLRKTTV